MFRRKLLALDYQQPDSFDINDESQLRSMILWLEDQKIRHYKIEERGGLRNFKSSDWIKTFDSYLQELGCPYQSSERVSVVEWMLGYAARLEYGDNVDKYKAITPTSYSQNSQQPGGVSTNPLDCLDFNDADFKAGITSLSMLLQVPPHSDHLEQLKAICLVVRDRLSKELLKEPTSQSEQGEYLPIDKVNLGFDTGDYIINEAAKILRLIHIRDLRDLQTQINSAIVQVQALIANPKTDSRLGKVGR